MFNAYMVLSRCSVNPFVLLIQPESGQGPGASIRIDASTGVCHSVLVESTFYESHFLSAFHNKSFYFIFSSIQSIIQHVYFEIVMENSSEIAHTCH